MCMLKTSGFIFMVLVRWASAATRIWQIRDGATELRKFIICESSVKHSLKSHNILHFSASLITAFQYMVSLLHHLTIQLFTTQLICFHLLLIAPEKHELFYSQFLYLVQWQDLDDRKIKFHEIISWKCWRSPPYWDTGVGGASVHSPCPRIFTELDYKALKSFLECLETMPIKFLTVATN